jgi:hypothetical protein
MNNDYFMNLQMKLWVGNGVFRVKVFVDHFDLSMAETCVRERLRICGTTSFPMLSDCRNVKRFDKDARMFLAEPQNTGMISAGALLINNQLQKVIGNFFILIDKPDVPAKLFTDEAMALNWLQQFKNIRSTA